MSPDLLLRALAALIPMLLSLTVHEYAHAWTAARLGDDTAERLGRLTLNPIPHIDPVGTLLLPALSVIFPGMPFFGWARPVPVDPTRFRRDVSMGAGMALTALAGPASNVLLAFLSAALFGLGYRFGVLVDQPAIRALLGSMMTLNLVLAIFNLVPIPPLDGSRFVDWLLPYRYRDPWHAVQQFSPFLLIGLFYLAPLFLSGPMGLASELLERFLSFVAGA